MRTWRALLIVGVLAVLLVWLGGCAGGAVGDVEAISSAGVTQYSDRVVVLEDGQAAVREHRFVAGKEYETVTVDLEIDKAGKIAGLKLHATGVDAFQGQQIAAAALVAVQQSLTELGVELGPDAINVIGAAIRAALGLP